MWNGNFLKMLVSEIRVNQIRVNQGLSVGLFVEQGQYWKKILISL